MNKFGRGTTSTASVLPRSALPEVPAATAFRPPRWAANPHLQTIWPNYFLPRAPAGRALHRASRAVVLEAADGDRLRVFWSRHPAEGESCGRREAAGGAAADGDRGEVGAAAILARRPTPRRSIGESRMPEAVADAGSRPVLVVLHGLTGCAASENVKAVGAKAHARGLDVVRVDLRNAQSDHPALGIGHAGRSEDLRTVLQHVSREAPGAPVAVLGFSLGGNVALKAAGEYGEDAPVELRAVAAISVPIDLDDACTAIDGPGNRIYRTYFLRRLAWRYRRLRALHPDVFPAIDTTAIQGIRQWDDAVVAPLAGFRDAAHYYEASSSVRVVRRIGVPTLVVQALDDPFIPAAPFRRPDVLDNPWLRLLTPSRGGHVGFWGASRSGDPDRWWAENRALDFCHAALVDG